MIDKLKYTKFYDFILPIHDYFDVFVWNWRGKRPPTPHLVKQRLVKKYAKRHSLKILIETGTYMGNMVNAVKSDFDKIYTIELDQKLYRRAKLKFKNEKRIRVLNGDSALVLKKILAKVNEPCLFWLDAHYSGGITAKGSTDTSIKTEIRHILKRKTYGDVLLIDDASLFKGKFGYPEIDWIRGKFKRSAVKITNNVIVISL